MTTSTCKLPGDALLRAAGPGSFTGARNRLPLWLKKEIPRAGRKAAVQKELDAHCLSTVCKEARCPNRAECFSKGTATFLIMGDACSRSCRFCSVTHATPPALDPGEPARVCDAVKQLKLSYVVITSVTRDDLGDGGAAHFAATLTLLKQAVPQTRIEILVPDFVGRGSALRTVLDCRPDVLNHNVETVPRLYKKIRPQADYKRSLAVLRNATAYGRGIIVKSGLMVGFGESEKEVMSVLRDLRESGCSIVTIGQYLQPSQSQTPVEQFVTPGQFERYEKLGRQLGFDRIFAGPFVRSSYQASEIFNNIVLG